jgi:hypothetical protein
MPKSSSTYEELQIIIDRVSTELNDSIESGPYNVIAKSIFLLNEISTRYQSKLSPEIQSQIERGCKLLDGWKESLQVGDTFEIYSEVENKWFQCKILELSENKDAYVSYPGWGPKFDAWLNLDGALLNPIGTFFTIKMKESKKYKIKQEVEVVVEEKEIKQSDGLDTSIEITDTHTTAFDLIDPEFDDFQFTSRARKAKLSSTQPNTTTTTTSNTKQSKTSSKGRKKSEKEIDHNDWCCTNCGMLEALGGSDLILCDGVCRRSFHVECFSDTEAANHAQVTEGNNDAEWYCLSCRSARHQCFLCKEEGIDYLVSSNVTVER